MYITLQCPSCGVNLRIDSKHQGECKKCIVCNAVITIPNIANSNKVKLLKSTKSNGHIVISKKTAIAIVAATFLALALAVALLFTLLPVRSPRNDQQIVYTPKGDNFAFIHSDQDRQRLQRLLEACKKLKARLTTGISLKAYSELLSDVQAAYESVNVAGWPESLENEKEFFECAIQAWEIALDVWLRDIDLGVKNRAYEYGTYTKYNDKCDRLATNMAIVTGNDNVRRSYARIIKKYDEASIGIIADELKRWALTVADMCIESAMTPVAIKMKIN